MQTSKRILKHLIEYLNELLIKRKKETGISFFIISYVLKMNYNEINKNLNTIISFLKYKKILKIFFKYLNTNIPIQYLIKKTFFYKSEFIINKNVLIPRFDSEKMIEDVINLKLDNVKCLEIGVGSGALIISVAKELDGYFKGVDINKRALQITRKNAKKHKVKIDLCYSNLFSNIYDKYNIIIANLPYLSLEEQTYDLSFEPSDALFCEDNGMYLIKKLIDDFDKYLLLNGYCFIEHGIKQQDEIYNYIIKKYNDKFLIEKHNDFSNKNRYIKIKKVRE